MTDKIRDILDRTKSIELFIYPPGFDEINTLPGETPHDSLTRAIKMGWTPLVMGDSIIMLTPPATPQGLSKDDEIKFRRMGGMQIVGVRIPEDSPLYAEIKAWRKERSSYVKLMSDPFFTQTAADAIKTFIQRLNPIFKTGYTALRDTQLIRDLTTTLKSLGERTKPERRK